MQRPGSEREVAAAIAARYGLPAAAIASRMARGRFRVKADIDRDTAARFAATLDALGAVCSVVAVDGDGDRGRPAPSSQYPVPPASPPPPRSGPPAPTAGNVAAQYTSGLGAAFTAEETPPPDLGALEAISSGGGGRLSLASPDGTEAVPVTPGGLIAAEPPAAGAAAADPGAEMLGVDDEPARDASGAEELDPFAPPEMAAETAVVLDVDADEPAPASAPPARPPLASVSNEAGAPAPTGARAPLWTRLADAMARDARRRFVAGVIVAAVVGLLAADVVARFREAGAYGSVLAHLRAAQAAATDPASWRGLDGVRADAVAVLRTRRTEIAITSLLIWIAVGAAVAFAWIRKIDWARRAPPRRAGAESEPRTSPPADAG